MQDRPNRRLSQNLDRLLALKGLGRKEAAEAIGVPYKWLRRAVSQGLGRPDQRNAPHLQRVTTFFGFEESTTSGDLPSSSCGLLPIGEIRSRSARVTLDGQQHSTNSMTCLPPGSMITSMTSLTTCIARRFPRHPKRTRPTTRFTERPTSTTY